MEDRSLLAAFNGVPIYHSDVPLGPYRNPAFDDGPVDFSSGDFVYSEVDLAIPGRGLNWSFHRTYHSGVVEFEGPLGKGWDHTLNKRLVEVNGANLSDVQAMFRTAAVGDVAAMDGTGRADLYLKNRDGSYVAPAGFYTRLVKEPDGTFVERNRDGTVAVYAAADVDGLARMTSVADRNGNQLTLQYDADDRLEIVVDSMGREIEYFYNSSGYLREVRDFDGRSVGYSYDPFGSLVSVTTPVVVGTPTHNDFPEGRTESYVYSSGFADPRLNHNLLSVTAPNEEAVGGPPRLVISYDVQAGSPHRDRVTAIQWGGANATGVEEGGQSSYEYRVLGAPPAGDLQTPTFETTYTDPNGNVAVYQTNQNGHLVLVVNQTNRDIRPGEGDFATSYEVNADGEVVQVVLPEGSSIEYEYSTNPDRHQQGNLLAITQTADADRGGDQDELKTTFAYEPIYNQVRTMVDPRGNDPTYVPPNGGLSSSARYATTTTFDYQEGADFATLAAELGVSESEVQQRLADAGVPMNLGDVNGDGQIDQTAGNAIRVEAPTVQHLPDSQQAVLEGDLLQEVVSIVSYNPFGQAIRAVDPERNVTLYHYYPEQDPDGDGAVHDPTRDDATGGYLREIIVDAEDDPLRNTQTNPEPAKIKSRFEYDPVGNVTRQIDGRGIATDFVVNELNEVVQITRAAAVDLLLAEPIEPTPLEPLAFRERIFYDHNGNVVQRSVEDRGNTSDVGIPGDLDGNGKATGSDFLAAQRSGQDAALRDWQLGFASTDGFVDSFYEYGILDRLLEERREVNREEQLTTRYRYDPNGNRVLTILPEGNATSAVYDERDLLFEATAGELGPPPLALLGPSDPTDYDVRGGLRSTVTYHYDGNGNLVEIVDADDTDRSAANNSTLGGTGDRTRQVYDGFDRPTSTIDPLGNQTVLQYDPASNVVRKSHFGPVGGASPTSDGINLPTGPVSLGGVLQVSNLVNVDFNPLLSATEFAYDELSRRYQTDEVLLVETVATVRAPNVADGATDLGKGDLTPSDNQAIAADIPLTAAIVGRVTTRTEYDRNSRPTFVIEDDLDFFQSAYDGVNRIVETVDTDGNVVQFAYDDNGNVIEMQETDVAQIAGVADDVFLTTYFYDSLNRLQRAVDNLGQTTDYRYDSRDNLVATADAEGPLTGATIGRRGFAGGRLTVRTINDFGNVTVHHYDGHNRRVRTETILTASTQGDGLHIGASIEGVKNDPDAPESFLPAADLTQGGRDGVIRTGVVYDKNSLAVARLDDQGNVTVNLFDNLDRPVAQAEGLTTATLAPWDAALVFGPREIVTPTAATIDSPATIASAQIDQQLTNLQTRVGEVAHLFPALADIPDDNPPTATIYGYDPDGNVQIHEDQNDTERFTRYDAANRPTAVRIFRAGQSDSHAADPDFALVPVADPANPATSFPAVVGTTRQDFQYDGLHRVVSATDNNDPDDVADDSVVIRAYDSLHRIIEEQQRFGSAPVDTYVVSAAWRADGLLSELVYPNGRAVEYQYDALDRVSQVADAGKPPLATYDYMGTSQTLRRVQGNGTQQTILDASSGTTTHRDGAGRVTELRHEKSERDGTTTLLEGFGYDFLRVGSHVVAEQKLHDPANNETHAYDSAYRRIGFARPQAGAIAPSRETWRLDGADNWTTVDEETRTYTSNNEIAARTEEGETTLEYDDNGNLTHDGALDHVYDAANRRSGSVVQADNSGEEVLRYDADNRRIERVDADANTRTRFLYFGDRVLEERDGANQVVRQYVYGQRREHLVMDVNADGGLSAIDAGDDRFYYLANLGGDIVGLTDELGNLVEAYYYDAVGERTIVFAPGGNRVVDFGGDDDVTPGGWSLLGNPYLFRALRQDIGKTLYLGVCGHYDPDLGRLINRVSGARHEETPTHIPGYLEYPNLTFHLPNDADTASCWIRTQQQNTSACLSLAPGAPRSARQIATITYPEIKLQMGMGQSGSAAQFEESMSVVLGRGETPGSASDSVDREFYPALIASVSFPALQLPGGVKVPNNNFTLSMADAPVWGRQEMLNNKYPENMKHEVRRGSMPGVAIGFFSGISSPTSARIVLSKGFGFVEDAGDRNHSAQRLVRYSLFRPDGVPLRAQISTPGAARMVFWRGVGSLYGGLPSDSGTSTADPPLEEVGMVFHSITWTYEPS